MHFTQTKLTGSFLVELEPIIDDRGDFSRTYCAREFQGAGLNTHWVQHNLSRNHGTGTLRGLHYQCAPFEEIKLVRCTKGAIFDVIVDLRPESPTYCRWEGFELTDRNGRALYIPEGFAHGFQTLADTSEVFYLMSAFYHPECARGVRWDDPAFGIRWPETNERILSPKDCRYPDLMARQAVTEEQGP